MSSTCGFQSISSEYAVIMSNVLRHDSVLDYVKAVATIVGSNQIRCAYKRGNDIIIYMKEKQYVSDVINAGVCINGVVANVGYGIIPFTKISLSNVDPILPNSVIQECLAPYGKFESNVICEKISSDIEYAHILTGLRHFYMKTSKTVEIPRRLRLTYDGVNHEINVSVEYPERCNGFAASENTEVQEFDNQPIETVNRSCQCENTGIIEQPRKRLKSSSQEMQGKLNTTNVYHGVVCQENVNNEMPDLTCEKWRFENKICEDVSVVQNAMEKPCNQKKVRFSEETNFEANSSSSFNKVPPKNGITDHTSINNSGSSVISADTCSSDQYTLMKDSITSDIAELELPDLNTLAKNIGIQSCENAMDTVVISSVEVVPQLHLLRFNDKRNEQEQNLSNCENEKTSTQPIWTDKVIDELLADTKYQRNQLDQVLKFFNHKSPDNIVALISKLTETAENRKPLEKIRINRWIEDLRKYLNNNVHQLCIP